MRIPPSPHFTALTLAAAFNADRAKLDGGLAPRARNGADWSISETYGQQVYKGIPFALGDADQANVILLGGDTGEVRIELDAPRATYFVFLHAAEDQSPHDPFVPFPDGGVLPGNAVGDWVSDYVLVFGDGTEHESRISRRFAI